MVTGLGFNSVWDFNGHQGMEYFGSKNNPGFYQTAPGKLLSKQGLIFCRLRGVQPGIGHPG